MGRRRKSGKWVKSAESVEDQHVGVAVESLDPDKDEEFVDEVDLFHRERHQELLLRSKQLNVADGGEQTDSEEEGEEEGVMDLDLESEEEEDADNELDQFYHQESEEEEDDVRAWGSKHKSFYNTNYVDDELGSGSEDEKAALEEEEEALAIQKRMAEALDEDDFDTAEFQLPLPDKDLAIEDYAETERVIKDLSKLSKDEKLEILLQESPELFELLDDFQAKMVELKERVFPLVLEAREKDLGNKQGRNYLEMKLKLLINYCTNVLFYFVLRSRQTPNLQHHPVISHLVQLRVLFGKLKPIDEKLAPEIEFILLHRKELMQTKRRMKSKTKRKNLGTGEVSESTMEQGVVSPEKKKKKIEGLDYYYKVTAEKAAEKREKKKAIDALKSVDGKKKKGKGKEKAAEMTSQEEGSRRGINYQISKNKGLTPHRKKERRNPRVKHRRKYTKAVIKRKSQVRPVLSAQLYYGGEQTGIRSHLAKSVKIH